MFLLIGIRISFRIMIIKRLAVTGLQFGAISAGIDRSFSGLDGCSNAAHGSGLVTALTGSDGSARIGEFNKMVVKYLAGIRTGAHFSPAHTLGRNGIFIQHPVGHINVVDMLFHNVIAAQPGKIIPVAHLVFHLILVWLPWAYPDTRTVPVHLPADNISNLAIADALQCLTIAVLIMTLQANNHI